MTHRATLLFVVLLAVGFLQAGMARQTDATEATPPIGFWRQQAVWNDRFESIEDLAFAADAVLVGVAGDVRPGRTVPVPGGAPPYQFELTRVAVSEVLRATPVAAAMLAAGTLELERLGAHIDQKGRLSQRWFDGGPLRTGLVYLLFLRLLPNGAFAMMDGESRYQVAQGVLHTYMAGRIVDDVKGKRLDWLRGKVSTPLKGE
jgi:hypothetical protein